MSGIVHFAPEAENQLLELFRYISEAASAEIAMRYLAGLVSYCEGLETFPQRGTQRDDIRPNLRVTQYRSRTVIAFVAQPDRVTILGIFHGGRNFESALLESSSE